MEHPTPGRDKKEAAHEWPKRSVGAVAPQLQLCAAPFLEKQRELRQAGDLRRGHSDRRWKAGFVLAPHTAHAGFEGAGDVVPQALYYKGKAFYDWGKPKDCLQAMVKLLTSVASPVANPSF